MSSPSGTVVQYNLSGSQYLYTDTGSYGTVTLRTLTVYGSTGNVIGTFNMGTNLTQIVPISADAWLHFQCVVTDNTGTWITDVYYVAAGYFIASYLNQYTLNKCGCITDNSNLEIANNAYLAALRYNLAGQAGAVSSNTCIVAANYFVNASPVVQFQ